MVTLALWAMYWFCSHMPNMAIQDCIDSDASVRIRCVSCLRVTVHTGSRLLARLGPMDMQLRQLQRNGRCSACRGLAEVMVVFPDLDVDTAKQANPASGRGNS